MPSIKELVKHLLYPSSSQPQFKDRTAVIQAGSQGAEDRVITHPQYERLIDHAQAVLAARGVQKQDKVLLTAPNCAELGAAIIAGFRLGAVAVPVDFRLTAGEAANVAKQISAKAIIAPAKVLQEISAKLEGTISGDQLIDILLLGPDAAKTSPESENAGLASSVLDQIDLNAPAFIILTSGTTGMPKGAEDRKSVV